MNMVQRKIYDQEYGFHMKDEFLLAKDNTFKEASNEPKAPKGHKLSVKSSPFGSFLIMA